MPVRDVLVVDDSKTESLFLARLLQGHGFSVRTAGSADDAMSCLARQRPDLILLYVVMPGRNGFQLARSLARDPVYSAVPIILCTSKSQETDRIWGLRQGARDFIVKPVDPASLLAKIAALG